MSRLILALAKVIVPNSLPESVLKENIKAVSKPLSSNLRTLLKDKKSLLHIVNQVIENKLPTILEGGEWITTNKDGVEVKEFVFTPKAKPQLSPQQKLEKAIKKENDRLKTENELKEGLVEAIDKQLRLAISDKWKQIQEDFESQIAINAEDAPILNSMKEALIKVFRAVFMSFIVETLLKPAEWLIMDGIHDYSRDKLRHINKITDLSINNNLYYFLIEDLLEDLVPTPDEPLPSTGL